MPNSEGYTGKVIRVDLTTKKVSEQEQTEHYRGTNHGCIQTGQ